MTQQLRQQKKIQKIPQRKPRNQIMETQNTKKQGGISIAVYPKGQKNKVTGLLLDNRVNYISPADYQEGSDLDSLVKCIIQEMKLSHTLQLKQKQQRQRESKQQPTT